ncbi:hypothetical protein [Brevundimonas sp. AJA228-03]|uniref:hypothetical protein n=1 Tax=Brevundimonas sp. AJA228-03 TaxID=2752515 RepID=UPI0035301587
MLVTTLFDAEGEEAAARAARQMAARSTPDGEPMLSANGLLLTQDWTGEIERAEADIERAGGEGALGGQEIGLADSEGRRHDDAGAFRYLAGAAPDAPLTLAARRMIETYRALGSGDRVGALTAAEGLDAILQSDGDVAFTFYEAPCFLGLGEGLSGRYAQAEAAFLRGDRYLACAAFRADVLEARGLHAEADRQYGVAIRLTPSLPFAYQRRALTLPGLSDTARAVTRFRDAHQRGPRWADPLKGWGDALAAQGRWAGAAEKYAQAEPFAPALAGAASGACRSARPAGTPHCGGRAEGEGRGLACSMWCSQKNAKRMSFNTTIGSQPPTSARVRSRQARLDLLAGISPARLITAPTAARRRWERLGHAQGYEQRGPERGGAGLWIVALYGLLSVATCRGPGPVKRDTARAGQRRSRRPNLQKETNWSTLRLTIIWEEANGRVGAVSR